jgi:uncharacterized protein (TIGR01777 family)
MGAPVRVAVVGATGLIGGHVARALLARGDEVVAVSRSGEAGIEGARDVRWVPADGPFPPEAHEGADAVVNLSGARLEARRWTAARKREIRESRTLTTRAIVDALAAPGAPRILVSASGVNYYGPRDEEMPETGPHGEDFLADTAVAWEREAQHAEAVGVRVVRIRSGIVLAREGGALPLMALPFRFFAGGPVGDGEQWVSWIHIDDEVGLILHALDHAEVSGPMNGTSPNPVRQRDFAKAIGRVLGRPSALPAPAVVVRVALGEMSTLALDGVPAVPAVALATGYAFVHPDLEEALRSVLG